MEFINVITMRGSRKKKHCGLFMVYILFDVVKPFSCHFFYNLILFSLHCSKLKTQENITRKGYWILCCLLVIIYFKIFNRPQFRFNDLNSPIRKHLTSSINLQMIKKKKMGAKSRENWRQWSNFPLSKCANMWCWTSIKLYLISLEMMCCCWTLNTMLNTELKGKVVTIYLQCSHHMRFMHEAVCVSYCIMCIFDEFNKMLILKQQIEFHALLSLGHHYHSLIWIKCLCTLYTIQLINDKIAFGYRCSMFNVFGVWYL